MACAGWDPYPLVMATVASKRTLGNRWKRRLQAGVSDSKATSHLYLVIAFPFSLISLSESQQQNHLPSRLQLIRSESASYPVGLDDRWDLSLGHGERTGENIGSKLGMPAPRESCIFETSVARILEPIRGTRNSGLAVDTLVDRDHKTKPWCVIDDSVHRPVRSLAICYTHLHSPRLAKRCSRSRRILW